MFVSVRYSEMMLIVGILFMYMAQIIKASYQKLPFGSGDDPDKLCFHQSLKLRVLAVLNLFWYVYIV